MDKINSIKSKSRKLGLFIFFAFVVLQLLIAYRLFGISENIQNNNKLLKQNLLFQELKSDMLVMSIGPDFSMAQEVRRLSFKTHDKQMISMANDLVNRFNTTDDKISLVTPILQYVQRQTEILHEKLKNAPTLDLTKENMIMFVLILIINIIINVVIHFSSLKFVKNVEDLKIGVERFFEFLARKRERTEKIVLDSDDEINEIATMVNKNIEKLEADIQKDNETVSEIAEVSSLWERGELSHKIESEPASSDLKILKKELNNFINGIHIIFVDILSTLDHYEQGDYTTRIRKDAEGELKKLMVGVNSLGNALEDSATEIVMSLKEKSENLSDTSGNLSESLDILKGNLNKENQNIGNVSQEVEQVAENIKSTVDKANAMNEVATHTKSSADKGEELADSTLNAMEEIKDSTEAINEAITVIDSIAFQTNILSLNAAVEAATAGEAGKGFAVVAQEVRNLASKSAEAAKEIKELVGRTQSKADEGMNISLKMKTNFSEVAKKIVETFELVNSVTSEANLEMDKIEKIKSLISEIREMADENARAMEGTSDIAQTLNQISTELNSEVQSKQVKKGQ
jgi:methyl-accepting chemotaxis protein